MAPLEIQLDIGKLKQALNQAPAKFIKESRTAFNRIGDYYIRKLTIEHLSGHGSKSLARRTSTLARSFNKNVDGSTLEDLRLTIFTDSKYARLHEYGGTIRPRNTKYLAIPIAAGVTGAGVSRFSSPRDVAGLKYGGKSKAGNIILRGPDGQPMFVLVRQVTIPARLNMFKTWDEIMPVIQDTLNNAMDKALADTANETR